MGILAIKIFGAIISILGGFAVRLLLSINEKVNKFGSFEARQETVNKYTDEKLKEHTSQIQTLQKQH